MKNRFGLDCTCCGYTTPPTHLCGTCPIPEGLKLTLTYRSVTVADLAHCSPTAGTDVGTIVQAMTYTPSAGTVWLTDWFHIADMQYRCGGFDVALLPHIRPDYWVRFQLTCASGSFQIHYAATPTMDPTCLPRAWVTGACGNHTIATQEAGASRGASLGSCDPVHLNSSAWEGFSPTPGEDGYVFVTIDITEP